MEYIIIPRNKIRRWDTIFLFYILGENYENLYKKRC